MAEIKSITVGFLFREFFPDYATFNTKIADTDLNGVYGITLDTGVKKYIYDTLYRQYINTPVMFSTPNAFLDNFQSYYTDYAGKVNRELQIIKKIYNLTEDELLLVSDSIANNSLNPNTQPADPKKPLDFVSSQLYSLQNQPKLVAYMQALSNLPTLKEREIIDYFRPLFYNVYNGAIFLYDGDNN